MTAVAPSIERVADGLRDWAGGGLDGPPEPVGGGFDTFIFRFAVAGRRLILRLYPSTTRGESARRETAILGFLEGVGYPAPQPVDWSADLEGFGVPFVIMEEIPGRTALDALRSRPRRVGELVGSLAAAQASLHAVAVDGWPHPVAGSEVDRRLAAIDDERVPSDPALRSAIAWLRAHADEVRGEEPAVCHFDFHPLNVLIADDGRLSVIDWENAALGDRHSDLARTLVLFEAAPAVASSALERVVLRAARPWLVRGYREAYRKHLPVDERRLRYWMAAHAVDGWWEWSSLVDGTFAVDTRTDERAATAPVIARAMERLFGRLVPRT